MSKMDALRAMREAKYAANSASGPTRREAAAAAAGDAPVAPRKASPARSKPAASRRTDAVAAPGGETCGHKSMNGRACTRDAGHSEKSHRYS